MCFLQPLLRDTLGITREIDDRRDFEAGKYYVWCFQLHTLLLHHHTKLSSALPPSVRSQCPHHLHFLSLGYLGWPLYLAHTLNLGVRDLRVLTASYLKLL